MREGVSPGGGAARMLPCTVALTNCKGRRSASITAMLWSFCPSGRGTKRCDVAEAWRGAHKAQKSALLHCRHL